MTEDALKPATTPVPPASPEELGKVLQEAMAVCGVAPTPLSPQSFADLIRGPLTFPLPERFSEPLNVSRVFRLKTGSKKGITALWKVWRKDDGYVRAWRCWQRIQRIEKKLKRFLDNTWKQLRDLPNTTDHHQKRDELNTTEYKCWRRTCRFIRRFAERYGIPPIDPNLDSHKFSEELEKVIRHWRPGKWQEPACAAEDEEDAKWIKGEMASASLERDFKLFVVIDPHHSLPSIQAAVEKHVKAWRARRSRKPYQWAQPKERLFDDYAKAWYLHFKKGWGWADIARKIFPSAGRVFYEAAGRRFEDKEREKAQRKVLADKARKYALCGKCLHRGSVALIKDEETPGVHPMREKREREKRLAAIRRKFRKKGVGKRGI